MTCTQIPLSLSLFSGKVIHSGGKLNSLLVSAWRIHASMPTTQRHLGIRSDSSVSCCPPSDAARLLSVDQGTPYWMFLQRQKRSRGAGIFGEVEGASSLRGGRRSAGDSEEEAGGISGKVNREWRGLLGRSEGIDHAPESRGLPRRCE
jgi:hypothetical protein